MLICPKCKLLYEKSTHCIRCGSSLVEKTSSDQEEIKAPPSSEINKESPSIKKPEDKKEELRSTPPFDFEERFPPKPTPQVDAEGRPAIPPSKMKLGAAERVKKPEPEKESPLDMEKIFHEVPGNEQRPEDVLPAKTKSGIGRSEKIRIKVPSLSSRKIGMIIVILIGGYFIWSVYSYFTPKKPAVKAPPKESSTHLIPPRSVAPAKPPAPLIEPKVADDKKLDKKSSISEKEAVVSPPTHSPLIASKASLSDEKEIEQIKKLLENIRQANLKKNIGLFMSCYSSTFKDRAGKRRETLKNWGNFTYTDLSYTLRKYSISGDTAQATVEWVIRLSPKAGGKPRETKTVLDVTLNKESGGWKIKNIKPVS